jgi:hypothetical protein
VHVPPGGRNLSSSAPELLAAQALGVLPAAVTQRGGGTGWGGGKAAQGRGKDTDGARFQQQRQSNIMTMEPIFRSG